MLHLKLEREAVRAKLDDNLPAHARLQEASLTVEHLELRLLAWETEQHDVCFLQQRRWIFDGNAAYIAEFMHAAARDAQYTRSGLDQIRRNGKAELP
jgi:hypothetical protein